MTVVSVTVPVVPSLSDGNSSSVWLGAGAALGVGVWLASGRSAR